VVIKTVFFTIPGKLTKPRQLHNSQWGMMCPAETPEGQVCILLSKHTSISLLVGTHLSLVFMSVIGLLYRPVDW